MALSPDARARYTDIIDSILTSSDLNTISEKRIRRGLQDAIGEDLTLQKVVIKELIMQRFDIFAEKHESTAPSASPVNGAKSTSTSVSTSTSDGSPAASSASPQPPKRRADTNENENEDMDTDIADSIEQTPPAKKQKQKQKQEQKQKQKQTNTQNTDDTLDSDAVLAAKLQAEENSRARPTRGAATRKAAPAKKKRAPAKSKGAKKISAEDDSEVELEPKEVNRTGGFHKPLNLSPSLAELLGEPSTVKKVWEYIRAHDLQDPSDRRHILCDEPMRAVFKQDRIHMFTMTKILSQNLYNPEE